MRVDFMMFTYRYDVIHARETFMSYEARAGNMQPFCPLRTHSEGQRAQQRAAKRGVLEVLSKRRAYAGCIIHISPCCCSEKEKWLLLLALTSEEQNMQRQARLGPAQLAMATHDHENA